MTSGSKVGYELAEYQFYPGLIKDNIKGRLDKLNLDEFDENERKVIALFEKAHNDGFEEKIYYDIETLEDMGEW